MKAHLISLVIFSQISFANISLEDLDYFRSISNTESNSIISSGTNHCNNFFDRNNLSVSYQKYENFFLCKFSKKRNRFYVYMLAVEKKGTEKLKDFCTKIINNWPIVSDHLDKNFPSENQPYLNGFYIDNFFNKTILDFSKNYKRDQRLINNEIDRYILENRKIFTKDNMKNNELIEKELEKISSIYKKIISEDISDLDKIIKNQLNKIVRYKIFINDTKKFISYSCNWEPKKGLEPYIKREKFSEFEDI